MSISCVVSFSFSILSSSSCHVRLLLPKNGVRTMSSRWGTLVEKIIPCMKSNGACSSRTSAHGFAKALKVRVALPNSLTDRIVEIWGYGERTCYYYLVLRRKTIFKRLWKRKQLMAYVWSFLPISCIWRSNYTPFRGKQVNPSKNSLNHLNKIVFRLKK